MLALSRCVSSPTPGCLGVSNASRHVADGTGYNDDEARRPKERDEPRGRSDVQINPGDETEVQRNECVALESADQ